MSTSGRWPRCPSSLALLPRCSRPVPAPCGTGWVSCRTGGTRAAYGSACRA